MNNKVILYGLIIVAVLLVAFNFNTWTGQASRSGQISETAKTETLKTTQTPTYILPEKTTITVFPEIAIPGEKIIITVIPKEGEAIDSEFALYELRETNEGIKEVFKDSETIPSIGPKILNKKTVTDYRIKSDIREGLYKIGFKIKGTNEIIFSKTFEVKK